MASRALQITYIGDAKSVLAAQQQINAGHTRMQGTATKTGQSFKQTFGTIIPGASLVAGAAVALAGKKMVMAASDQGEALNKSRVIFEQFSGDIEAFADTSATSFGISKTAALDAASGFGAMFDSAGLAEDAAADMSIAMVKLAADMASFNNQDPSEMLMRLRSGLAGEAEPLRRFGVFLSEAAVKSQAYADGIAKTGAELTEAQKVQARYSLILEQTTKQQGDFARTVGESLPNQLRVLGAELEDVAADMGRALLPIVTKLVKSLAFLLDNIEAIAIGFGAWVALRYAYDALMALVRGLQLFNATAAANVVTQWAASLSQAAPQLLKLTLLVTGLYLAGKKLNSMLYETKEAAVSSFAAAADAYKRGEITFYEFKDAVAAVEDQVSGETERIREGNIELDRLQNAYQAGAAVVVEFERAEFDAVKMTREAKREMQRLREAGVALAEGFPTLTNAVGDFTTELSKTPAEYVKNAREGAKWARTVANSVDELVKADIPKKVKKMIAEAGEEAIVAWARMNEGQRREFQRSLKQIDTLRGDILRKIRRLRDDLYAAGADATVGLGMGMASEMAWLKAKAAEVARAAVEAAKRELREGSPSKVMFEVGSDFVQGIIDGIGSMKGDLWTGTEKMAQGMVKVLERELRNLEREMDRALGAIEKRLDRWRSKADDLASAVSGSFRTLLDLGGAVTTGETGEPVVANLQEFFAAQLQQAQQWASILKALGAQGVGAALLGEIAGMGPATGIPFAQALLQQGPEQIATLNAQYEAILGLQEEVADSLTNAYFGERIQRLEDELKEARQEYREHLRAIEAMLRVIARALDRVTPMQSGGIVTRPTLALLGETAPEAVIPLRRSSAGLGSVVVNIYGDVTGEDVVDKVEEALTRRFARGGSLFNGALKG